MTRPKRVIVTGITPNGEKTEYTANGLLAKAFCHEIDHLDGVLYMDKAKKCINSTKIAYKHFYTLCQILYTWHTI